MTERSFTHEELFGFPFGTHSPTHMPNLMELVPEMGTDITYRLRRFNENGERETLARWMVPGSGDQIRIEKVKHAKERAAGNDEILKRIADMGLRNNDFACFPAFFQDKKLYGVVADFSFGGLLIAEDGAGNKITIALEPTPLNPARLAKYQPKQSGSNIFLDYDVL